MPTSATPDKECAQGHYVGPYFSPYKKDGGYKKGGKGDNHVLFYGKVYAKLAIWIEKLTKQSRTSSHEDVLLRFNDLKQLHN